MTKWINKNFDFLIDKEINFDKKEEVIEKINEIHELIQKKALDYVFINLRKLVELILKEFLLNQGRTIPNTNGIYELLKEIENNFGNGFNSEVINAGHQIRRLANESAHHQSHSKKMMISNIVICLNGIREMIWYCFKLKGNDSHYKLADFDENIYFIDGNEKQKNIEIIDKSINEYRNVRNNDISINKTILKHWMMQDKIIMIPIYQRGYTWTINQIDTLFDDILSRYEDDSVHYFGVIAGKNVNKKNLMAKTQIKIIDGQQRLTSSLLFVCAIREVMKEIFKIKIEEEILINEILRNDIENYFYNPGGTWELNQAFKNILKCSSSNNEENSKLKKTQYHINFLRFKELLQNKINEEKWDAMHLRSILNTFLIKFELATISFDDHIITNKKEMEIFENLNSKGKALEIEDLIKNYIFNLCSEDLLQDEGDKKITSMYITNIINELNADPKKIQNFFMSLIQYNSGNEISKNNQIQLKEFKTVIHELFKIEENKEIDNIKEYEKLLISMKNYSKIFHAFVYEKGGYIPEWLGIEKIIQLCGDQKKITLFVGMTYLIDELLKRDSNIDCEKKLPTRYKKEIKKIFLIIMKSIVKNSIITVQGDSGFKRMILKSTNSTRRKFLEDKNMTIEKLREIFELEMIKDQNNNIEQFRKELSNNTSASQSIKWLLILTEWEMSDYLNGGAIIDYKKASVEHIMPQQYYEWKNELENTNISKEEWSNKIDKIGNYFIIETNKNAQAKNYIFSKKLSLYKSTSPLFCCSTDKDIDISNQSSWNFEKIEKRTQKLIDYICNNVIK